MCSKIENSSLSTALSTSPGTVTLRHHEPASRPAEEQPPQLRPGRAGVQGRGLRLCGWGVGDGGERRQGKH